jgi:hypothetical protein
METETPAESLVVDEAENQSFLGFKFGALIDLEKSVVSQQLRKTLSTTWIGAERENFRRGLTLDLRQPCLVFRVRMIRKWSILNRFYSQTGACLNRPRRQLNAPGPSV